MPRHKGVKEGEGQAAQSTGGGVIGSLGHKGGTGGQEVQRVVSGESRAQRIGLEALGPVGLSRQVLLSQHHQKREALLLSVSLWQLTPRGCSWKDPHTLPSPHNPATRTVVPGTAKARVCSDRGEPLPWDCEIFHVSPWVPSGILADKKLLLL